MDEPAGPSNSSLQARTHVVTAAGVLAGGDTVVIGALPHPSEDPSANVQIARKS
jgi:hypothetical protein